MRSTLTTLAPAFVLLLGCEYVEPPSVDLTVPEGGTFVEGQPLVFRFSEPIDPASVVIDVWADERDLEGELPADATPLLAGCTATACTPPNVLTIADDHLSAELSLDPAGIGKPDVPLLAEVQPGLVGDAGAATGHSSIFDFQFKPAEISEDAVPFEEGIYLVVSEFEQPIPNVLTLMSHVLVSERGEFLIVGAESDEIEGAAQNTRDPSELFIDTTEQGFVAFAKGRIRQNDAGERFVETETFEITLRLAGLQIQIFGLRFTGIVVKNPETNLDQLQGTLSFEGIALSAGDNDPFVYDAGTSVFIADQVPAELVPPGTPDICTAPCGDVPGQCEVPEVWPPPGFCGVPYP
ncbi:MAG: hypothetical protein H6700_10300 [Myxococcales bacterium]|nr:hypothetical protein [Myxococcales bacterium]